MNDLGIALVWLAVQVSLVLAPGLVFYGLAARRSPAAGASVAALSLAMVVALTVAAFLPGIGRGRRIEPGRLDETSLSARADAPAAAPIPTGREAPSRPSGERWAFAGWRVAWARFERTAAEPAARCRPWAGTMAVLFLAGTAAGLLRLALGLGAVVTCRRRGRPVDDPAMIGLMDELRQSIGCRAAVELRQVPDLVGPATAGWWRPAILLPPDWRSWDISERRAVLAHELAHIVRGDYAAGLLARLALALNGYHPMVWWMAGQLRLQQELAADATGARLAGGRTGYLVALSRLALRQDGRSPWWPARAFLPARGTLIRRITMLRDETRNGAIDRPWTPARHLATTAILLGVTAGVLALRGPARGGESAKLPSATATGGAGRSSPPLYLRDDMAGVFVFRPAAVSRHLGAARLVPSLIISEMVGIDFDELPRTLGVDTSAKGFIRLDRDGVEWVAVGLGFGRMQAKDGKNLHRIQFGGLTVRTVAPFDWLAYLRQWHLEFAGVREGQRPYYRVSGPLQKYLGFDPCVYVPDDRTIVLNQEKVIRKLAGGEVPPLPAFLRGPDWERARSGLLAIAINNENGKFAKDYDLGRPDDAVVLSLLKGVDHWTFSVDDADAMVLRASVACDGGDASEFILRSIDSHAKRGLDALDHLIPRTQSAGPHDRIIRLARSLLANLRIEHNDRAVALRTDGFGTLADFASILGAEIQSEVNEVQAKGRSKGAKP